MELPENEALLGHPADSKKQTRLKSLGFPLLCYISLGLNVMLLLALLILLRALQSLDTVQYRDPGLAVYSPANSAVEYIDFLPFRAALFNNTPYMGAPDSKKDKLWSDLYNMGISKITKQEALLLPMPTLPITGTEDYLIELDVFHELHCLNDLRKTLWPEYFPNMSLQALKSDDGSYQRDNDMFRHWDHCIDSIRQALMCHADVAPISFHVNVPGNTGIFPRLATTHTCRNFTRIQQWAVDHSAGKWKYKFDDEEEVKKIIASADFDQGPLEDIQFLYRLFPGNEYFEYWRTHDPPKE